MLLAMEVRREYRVASRSSSRSRLSSKVGEVGQVDFLHRNKRVEAPWSDTFFEQELMQSTTGRNKNVR